MKLWRIVPIIIFLFVFMAVPVVVTQQPRTDDRITVRKSDLPPDLVKQIEAKNQVQAVGAWVGIGKEVGTAVNEGLSALTKNADDFSKTDVGKFTMWMIAWKVMGWQLIHITFGLFFFVVGIVIFTWSWFLSGRTRKIQIGTNTQGPQYEIVKPSEEKLLGYGIWLIAHIVISCIIIFSG